MTTPAAPAAQATPEAAKAPEVAAAAASPAPGAKSDAGQAQLSILGTAPEKTPEKPAGEGDKAKEEPAAKANEPVPTELKVTLPEGMKLDESILKGLTDEAAKLKLSSEQASGLGAFLAAEQKRSEEADVAEWSKRSAEWAASVKADKDFGGANFDATVADAQKAIIQFGGKDLAAELEKWGLQNFPPLVKAFARAGKALGEDTSRSGAPAGQSGPTTRAEQLRQEFPSMFNADGSPKY
jgi:hypothetical protein